MGRVASSVDNTMIELFWSTMQRELLDTQRWPSQKQLTAAIFEWIEAWYTPRRRHNSLSMLAAHELENLHTALTKRHDHHTTRVRRTGSGSGPHSLMSAEVPLLSNKRQDDG
jgi:transposase InsO family protein